MLSRTSSLAAVSLVVGVGCSPTSAPSPVAQPQVATSARGLTANAIVISQFFGGGGNSGAPLNRDYVALFNRSSAPQSLSGGSIQYASAAGTFNSVVALTPSVTLQPGQYYLIALATGANGSPLPTPDQTGTPNLSGTNGKLLVASTTVALSSCGAAGSPCTDPAIVDLVGWGSGSQFEGTAAAPVLSNTTAGFRAGGGCIDTNDNSADFSAGAPAPRTTTSPLNPCSSVTDAGAPDAVVVTDTGPRDTGVFADATAPDAVVVPDTGPFDTGAVRVDTGVLPVDAGFPDAAAIDVGPADTGVVVVPDAGVPADTGASLDATPGDAIPANPDATPPDATPPDAAGDAGVSGDVGAPFDGGPFAAVLNEIKVNPPGADNGFEYVELRGSGTLPGFTYVLSVEGDSTSTPGRINWARELTGVTFGSNGIIFIGQPANYTLPPETTVVTDLAMGSIQNGTESIVLVQSTAPIVVGSADGGTPTAFPFMEGTVIDSVGWKSSTDAGAQGTVFGGVDLTFAATPDGVTRFLDQPAPVDPAAWYAGKFTVGTPGASVDYDPGNARSANFPVDGIMTPGAPNIGTLSGPRLDAGFNDAFIRDAFATDNGGADDAVSFPDATTSIDAQVSADSGSTGGSDAAVAGRDAGARDSGTPIIVPKKSGCTCAADARTTGFAPLFALVVLGLGLRRSRRV